MPVSHADEQSAIDVPEHKKHSALATLRRMNNTLKQHTAVTTTEEEPGVHSGDQKAGTAVPVAERANPKARNAGFSDEFDHEATTHHNARPAVDGATSRPQYNQLSSDQKSAEEAYRANDAANNAHELRQHSNDAVHPDDTAKMQQQRMQSASGEASADNRYLSERNAEIKQGISNNEVRSDVRQQRMHQLEDDAVHVQDQPEFLKKNPRTDPQYSPIVRSKFNPADSMKQNLNPMQARKLASSGANFAKQGVSQGANFASQGISQGANFASQGAEFAKQSLKNDSSLDAEVERRRRLRHGLNVATTDTQFKENEAQSDRAERVRAFLSLVQQNGLVDAQREEQQRIEQAVDEQDAKKEEEEHHHRFGLFPHRRRSHRSSSNRSHNSRAQGSTDGSTQGGAQSTQESAQGTGSTHLAVPGTPGAAGSTAGTAGSTTGTPRSAATGANTPGAGSYAPSESQRPSREFSRSRIGSDTASISSKRSFLDKPRFNILHPRRSMDARRTQRSERSIGPDSPRTSGFNSPGGTSVNGANGFDSPRFAPRQELEGATAGGAVGAGGASVFGGELKPPSGVPSGEANGSSSELSAVTAPSGTPSGLPSGAIDNEFSDAPEELGVQRTSSPPNRAASNSLTPRNRFVPHSANERQDGVEQQQSEEGAQGSLDAASTGSPVKGADRFPDGSRKVDLDHVSLSDRIAEVSGEENGDDPNSGEMTSADGRTYKHHLDPEVWQKVKRGQFDKIERRLNKGEFLDDDDMFSSEDEVEKVHAEKKHGEKPSSDKPLDERVEDEKKKETTPESDYEDAEEDVSEKEGDDEDLNIPAGSVPGLGVGDMDPKLPHEKLSKKEQKKKIKEKTMSDEERLKEAAKHEHTAQARQRFKDQKSKVRMRQERQAESAGWRQIGGWEGNKNSENSSEENQDLLSKSTLLDNFIADTYLGDWYQNAGLIILTAFFAWVLGRLRFSVSWISIVLLFSASAYRTSVRRMRRNTRDDILRQVLLESSAERDTETMEWLNSFLIKFWLIFEPSLSQMITEIGNEVLQENTPPFIHSIKLDKFTLGTKAPRVDFVTSFPRTNAQIVVIDMGCSFTPNDTMDLTKRQLETKVNPKVQLGVRIGKGPLVKNLPILLEDMMFKGKFRLRFKLMERAPHIQTLDFSFLAPPEFDFVLKPIGGDTFGFDINVIPGLSKFIKETVHANLGPMLYAPNAFQVNVEQLMAGVGVMSGVGVLTVQVIEANDLTRSLTDGRVDPYVVVRDKGQKDLAHTKIKKNTTNPQWNETINVIITNPADNVLLEVFDFDENQPDRSIGQVPIQVDQLVGSEISRSEITSGGRKSGYLKFIAKYSPVIMPDNTEDGASASGDLKSGILNLSIQHARNLNPSISKVAKLSPSADIEFSGKLMDSTKVVRNTNNPEWNFSSEHIVLDKVSTLLTVRVKDFRGGKMLSPQAGLFKIRLGQLLIENEKGHKWFQLKDNNGEGAGTLGEIKIETQWKPANISVGGSTNNYVQPVGVVRLNVKNAKSLRNLEHIGKIDPYARAFVGKRLVGRTDWFKNDLNPVWNESLYFPIQSENQDLTIEVMDVENRGKDRSLGAFKVKLSSLLKRDEYDNLKVFVSEKSFESKLMLPNRGPKGTLEYALEFYPAIPVVSPAEREQINTDKRVIELFEEKIRKADGKIEKALTPAQRNELLSHQERLDFSGVDMPVEELLTYQAGVFAVAIVSLKGHRLGQRLRVVANNSPFPIFTSPKFKSSKRFTSDDCPDFVSGQIHLSSLRFDVGTFGSKTSLSGADEDGEDGDDSDEELNAHDINAAEITIPCFELIRDASFSPKAYSLQNGAVIELQARFFPLPGLIIDPSEDISHCGNIEVNLIKAVDVPPADSSGLSDPYCAFYLNDERDKVYKSKTHKETLNPVWNEFFRFAVEDYRTSSVKAIVNDWDMGNADDFLGGFEFDLSTLKALEWRDYEVDLVKLKRGREVKDMKPTGGKLYLRMRFLPGMLQKDGKGFLIGAASAQKVAGGLAHIAEDGVVGVVGAAGLGVSSAFGLVGAAAQGPTALKSKIHEIGNKATKSNNKMDKLMKSYSVNIDSLSGFANLKNDVQIRCSTLGEKEHEIFKSQTVKLENGESTLDISFNFRALPDAELGVKVVELKSLGRHSDVGQSSTDLTPGPKEVLITKESLVSLSLSEDS